MASPFLWWGGKSFIEGCLNVFRSSYLEYLHWDLQFQASSSFINQLLWDVVKLVAPVFAVILVAGVIANYVQVGFMFNLEGLKINLGRINPLEGAKNIFGSGQWWSYLNQF